MVQKCKQGVFLLFVSQRVLEKEGFRTSDTGITLATDDCIGNYAKKKKKKNYIYIK